MAASLIRESPITARRIRISREPISRTRTNRIKSRIRNEPGQDNPDQEKPGGDTGNDGTQDNENQLSFAAQVARLVNEERAKAGLSPLQVDQERTGGRTGKGRLKSRRPFPIPDRTEEISVRR